MTKQKFLSKYVVSQPQTIPKPLNKEYRQDLNALIKEAQREAYNYARELTPSHEVDEILTTFEDWFKQQEK